MKLDDIIRMAREAGLEDWAVYGRIERKEECLERFAALVAAAEREACARVCENIEYHDETIDDIYYSDHYAKAIRARGEA